MALGADEGEADDPTLAVSALSEKSIEFSSRCPGAGAAARAGAGAAWDAWPAPLLLPLL